MARKRKLDSTFTRRVCICKSEVLQTLLLNKYNEFFPEKTQNVSSDDQPFYNDKLSRLRRRKGREYRKHRRSEKWLKLEKVYNDQLVLAKKSFYRRKIKNLRKVNPGKWYNELKKLTSFDQQKSEEIIVESIKDLTIPEQAERIADKFAEVSNEYDKLRTEDIEIPHFTDEDIPQFTEDQVKKVLREMNTKKSNVHGDIPARIFKELSDKLAKPVTQVINCSIRQGLWPHILKLEIVTPVPNREHSLELFAYEQGNIGGTIFLTTIVVKTILNV